MHDEGSLRVDLAGSTRHLRTTAIPVGDTDEGRHNLIAVARYFVAHSPTERAALQTADIARRLMRGGELHQAQAS